MASLHTADMCAYSHTLNKNKSFKKGNSLMDDLGEDSWATLGWENLTKLIGTVTLATPVLFFCLTTVCSCVCSFFFFCTVRKLGAYCTAKQALSHLDTPSAGLLFFTSYHTRLCFLVEQSGLRSIYFQTQWTGRAALASLLPCCTLPRESVKRSFLCFPMFSPHFACLRQVKRRTKIIILIL